MGSPSRSSPLANLLKVQELYGVKNSTLSLELGYSGTAVVQWKKKGLMPYVASLACEALIRRKGHHKEEAESKLNAVYSLLQHAASKTQEDNTRRFLEAAELIIKG